MAEYSKIRFKRTRNSEDPIDHTLMNNDYPLISDMNNHITNLNTIVCEPWVQTYHRQLWIDNVCINPHLYTNTLPSGSQSLFELDNVFVNGEMVSNLTFRYDTLLLSLASDTNPFKLLYESSVYPIYNPFTTTGNALVLGNHMVFNNESSLINSEYINNINIVSGSNLLSDNINVFENYNSNDILSNHVYLWVNSTLNKNHLCDITGTLRPNYGTTLTLDSATDTLNLSQVTVNISSATPSALVHEGTFNAITSLSVDNYGRVIGYTNTTYTLPEGSDGGGTAVNQTLTATLGSQIVGTDPAESHFAVLRLSGDNTPIMLKGIASDGNDNGTDIRMSVTNSNSEDTVIIKIHCIDGGLIQ